MRYTMTLVAMVLMFIIVTGTSFAQKGPVETALEGCKDDLETYCKNVTPGAADTGMSLRS